MVTAMWYVLRTGIPWRDLPPRFGPWSSVYTRFRRWCASGLWPGLLEAISTGAVGDIRCVDCSFIKVHRDGANTAGRQKEQGMGRTKGGLNTKLAAVVDGLAGPSASTWLQDSSMTCGRALPFNRSLPGAGPSPTEALTRTASGVISLRQAPSSAFLRAVVGARRSTSISNCTSGATWSKTSSAGSNATGASQPGTKSWRSRSMASSASPRCSTGSALKFEKPALQHRPAFHFPAAETESGHRQAQDLPTVPRVVGRPLQLQYPSQSARLIAQRNLDALPKRQSPGCGDLISQIRPNRRRRVVIRIQPQTDLVLGHRAVRSREHPFLSGVGKARVSSRFENIP